MEQIEGLVAKPQPVLRRSVLAIVAVFVALLVLSSPRLDGIEEAVETFIGNTLLAIWTSSPVQEAQWLVYYLVVAITDGELGYQIQQRLGTDNWPSNLLAPNWTWDDLAALIIWGGFGGFFTWHSRMTVEARRRLEAWKDYPISKQRELAKQQPLLPSHPNSVFVMTAASALLGLWSVEADGWGMTIVWAGGVFLVWLVWTTFAVSNLPGTPDELPKQTAYGDAHWATLDEVLQKTNLLDGDEDV